MILTGSDVQDTEWLCVRVQLLLPCFTPPAVQHLGIVYEVVEEGLPLMREAIRDGCPLDMAALRSIHASVGLPLPERKQGSGKNGSLIKDDFCRALIAKFFSDEPQSKKDQIFEGLMGRAKIGARVRCAQDVLDAVQEMGKEAERDFAFIHEVARNQIAVEKQARRERTENLEQYEKKTYTPPELKHLLPPQRGAFCNRNPLVRRYQVGYPGRLVSKYGTSTDFWG